MLALPLLLAAAVSATPPSRGEQLYMTDCASCHAAQKWGTADGPSLRGVGLAAVDFYLRSGRMPAAVPWIEVGSRDERSGQQLPLDDIRAIEAYLAPDVAGGPPIPEVAAGGNLEHGRSLFALNCEQCHGVQGEGGGIGGLAWAPSLRDAPINVVADAIRVGPEEMPTFGEHQLSSQDVIDIATYVTDFQISSPSAPPFRSTGPVPEGAVGYLLIIVLVAFVFTFWRVETPAREREETKRRDEGELPV
jgi:ubiquinol-cytochrome c reductase cytochrome c subunit